MLLALLGFVSRHVTGEASSMVVRRKVLFPAPAPGRKRPDPMPWTLKSWQPKQPQRDARSPKLLEVRFPRHKTSVATCGGRDRGSQPN